MIVLPVNFSLALAIVLAPDPTQLSNAARWMNFDVWDPADARQLRAKVRRMPLRRPRTQMTREKFPLHSRYPTLFVCRKVLDEEIRTSRRSRGGLRARSIRFPNGSWVRTVTGIRGTRTQRQVKAEQERQGIPGVNYNLWTRDADSKAAYIAAAEFLVYRADLVNGGSK